MELQQTQLRKPHYSIPSIVAVVAAILSFVSSAGWAFILAIVAIVCGIIGLMMSFSPNIRGGAISVLSLVLAGLGIVFAIVRLIGRAF